MRNGNGEKKTTVYISIGNSDDRLSQAEWSEFVTHLWLILTDLADTIHGVWFSESTRPYQNGCWCVELPATVTREMLGASLRAVAVRYHQCAITVAEVQNTFVYAEGQATYGQTD